MVKVKNKRNRDAADKLRKIVKKPNPFEIHINKQKFQVLGQKLKNDRGLPGISRTKAINKRKKTLLPEFNLKNKVNTFLDRRIGEKNKYMAPEDRIIARFTAERIKLHKKKSIFNLGDDEVLTHKGQTLNDIEKFDDPRSEDEFSDDEGENRSGGRLDADFVEDAHFGGGVLSNTGKEGAKSRKDLIEQLIAESKKRKAEKQKLREETVQLTEKLDTEWKDLLPLVNKNQKDDSDETKKVQVDDFDKVMRELRFEARGNPTDRLRTEDEIAKEEKERLEKLEFERLARMKGLVNDKEAQSKHRSADDLDDDFLIESDLEENQNEDDKSNDENQSAEDDGEEEEEIEGDENNEDDSDDNLSDLKTDENSESESDNESNQNGNIFFNKDKEVENSKKSSKKEAETNADDSDDNLTVSSESESDHKSTQSNNKLTEKNITNKNDNKFPKIGDEDASEENVDSNESLDSESNSEGNHIESEKSFEQKEKKLSRSEEKTPNKKLQSNLLKNDPSKKNSETSRKRQTVAFTEENTPNKKSKVDTNINKIMEDLLARKKIMEDARNELPYTFSIPDTYEEFEKLFETKSVAVQTIIIERMIKCTHPSLGESNKEKLSILFTYLLQFINDLGSSNTNEIFQFLDHIMPYLYDLTQTIQKDASNAIISVLKEKQSNFREKRKKYPQLDTLILFKMISLLFPTSDFRHQVVTPSLIFIDQLLTRCKVKTRRDIGAGLFLVTHVLEYVSLSKRFLPSVINYLRGLIHLSIPKITVRAIPIIPPFKPFNSLLVLTEKYKDVNEFKMTFDDLIKTDIDDDFKVRTLYIVLKLCLQFYQLYEQLITRVELFEPILNLLHMLPMEKYPQEVKEIHKKLKTELINGKNKRKMAYLVVAAQKPKALRLYEPNIQQVFENRKHRNLPKEKQEHDKLVYKLKKEKKGALREIRRDNAFLSKLKIKQQIESDKERKEKVKEILSGASIQQGELNALDRKRKKK